MKIIKYGKNPEDLEYIKKCPNCKTVFVYQESESTYELDISESINHLVQCPFCQCNVPVGLLRKTYNPDKHGIVIEIKEPKEEKGTIIKSSIGFRKEIENDRTNK